LPGDTYGDSGGVSVISIVFEKLDRQRRQRQDHSSFSHDVFREAFMAVDPAAAPEMTPAAVFVSYSRKDTAFVDRLETALKARGFASKIDRSDIYAFEDWRKRVEELIVSADTIVFVLSPDAVASDVCRWEVALGAELRKRFAPIVCRATQAEKIPAELARLNFVFFDDAATFEASADRLAEALATDIDWVRSHTRFGELARRWTQAGRGAKGLLLRPPALEEAERWIAARPAEAPDPTEATRAFIAESRRAEAARRKTMLAALAAGVAVALGLGGWALNQQGAAERNAEIARARRLQEQKNLVASYIAESDAELGKDNIVPALQRAIAAAETEAQYAGASAKKDSDAALRRLASKDRLIFHVKRESDLPLWPFDFVDEKTLVYTTKNDGLFAVDLSTRRLAWRVDPPGLVNPHILKIREDGEGVYVAGGSKLFVVAPGDGKILGALVFPEAVIALGLSQKRQELAVGFEKSILFFDLRLDLGDADNKPTRFTLPRESGGRGLKQLAYDRNGGLYIVTAGSSGRDAHLAVLQRPSNRFKLLATGDVTALADGDGELDTYRDADRTAIFVSPREKSFGLFEEKSGKLTDFRQVLLSMQMINGGPIYHPAALHYIAASCCGQLYAISRSNPEAGEAMSLLVQLVGDHNKLLNMLELKYRPRDFIPPLLRRCRYSGPSGFLACFYSTADGEGILA
jgi:hypothetical protein